MHKYFRAALVEPLVWEGVSELLGEPERLRRGLQKMLENLSTLESDAEHFLEAHEKRCVEALADLSPEERREVYKLLDLTVEAHPTEGSKPLRP
jgi:hypothetical protein